MAKTNGFLVFAATGLLFASAAYADVVKVGVLAPLTGAAASDGEDFVRGVQLAVEEANAKGGVAGHTFEVVSADIRDQTPDNVSSAAERLIGTEGIGIVLSGYASLSAFEIDLFADAGVPYINAGPSGSFLNVFNKAPEANAGIWSFTPSFKGYETDVAPFVEKLVADGKFAAKTKTIAIVSSDNPYSKTISDGLKASFTAAGWKITVDELVPFGQVNDWRPIIAKIRDNPPALVVNTDYQPANSALFLKQFLSEPTQSLVFLQYAPSVPEFVELTKEQSTGVIYNLIGGTLDTPAWPRGAEVNAALEKRFGAKPGYYGPALYEEAQIYFKALEKVGDPKDLAAVGKAIGKIEADTASGPLVFDPATHLPKQDDDHIPVTFWQLWDGKRVLLQPAKYATGEFRLPPWISK